MVNNRPTSHWIAPMAILALATFSFLGLGCAGKRTLGTIEILSPKANALIPAGAKMEILGEGYDWAEGPVWVPDETGGHVLFSDIPPNSVYRWKEGQGVSLYLKPAGYTGDVARKGEPGCNGLALDKSDGTVVFCEHGNRRIAKLVDPERAMKITLADNYQGKRFNSPNDLVFHTNGDLYFTDPPYGLEKRMDDPAKELDFQGVYRLSKDKKVTLLTKEMTRPNGIGFSPDEKTLYVANSDPKMAIWKKFPVNEDGTLGEGTVLADKTEWVGQEDKKGLPDGLAVDTEGNIYATGPGGVLIFTPEGEHIATLATGQATANCGFGEDGHTLFITADYYFLKIRLKAKGLGF